jgi:uncharacterized membrane protein (DUF4010 family)
MLNAFFPVLVALGIGLLIGIERERLKGEDSNRRFAGIRTFTISSLMGCISMMTGSNLLFGLAVSVISLFCMVGYLANRDQDPGLTTEISLVLTCFLGGMTVINMPIAVGSGVAVAFLLRIKQRIHYFVKQTLTNDELDHLLLFVAIILVVYPFTPDVYLGPFNAFNPKKILTLMLVMMTISAASYILIRLFGEKYGVIASGFASGFISSTATVFALGKKVSDHLITNNKALAGLCLSSISSLISIILVMSIFGVDHLDALLMPFIIGFIYLGVSSFFLIRSQEEIRKREFPIEVSRVFDLVDAAKFATMVTLITLLGAVSYEYLGQYSIPITMAISGLIDVHAATSSILSMVHSHKLIASDAPFQVLTVLTINNTFKSFLAVSGGTRRYGIKGTFILMGLSLVLWVIFYLVNI